jgi:hypothetical protein
MIAALIVVGIFLYIYSCVLCHYLWKKPKKVSGRMSGAEDTSFIGIWPFILLFFILLIWPIDFMVWTVKLSNRVKKFRRSKVEVVK